MKTTTSVFASAALLTVLAASAHAQMAYETMRTSSTETLGGVTTNVQTQYTSTTTLVPAVMGDAPATPALTADNRVSVKLPSGEIIQIADSSDAPWNKDSRLASYNRFTFDPVSGAFVAGMGDVKFESNWDENGNRVQKTVKTTKKVVVEETVAGEAPAEVPAQ